MHFQATMMIVSAHSAFLPTRHDQTRPSAADGSGETGQTAAGGAWLAGARTPQRSWRCCRPSSRTARSPHCPPPCTPRAMRCPRFLGLGRAAAAGAPVDVLHDGVHRPDAGHAHVAGHAVVVVLELPHHQRPHDPREVPEHRPDRHALESGDDRVGPRRDDTRAEKRWRAG